MKEIDEVRKEYERTLDMYCNKTGCEACIFARYDGDGKQSSECRATDLQGILLELEREVK